MSDKAIVGEEALCSAWTLLGREEQEQEVVGQRSSYHDKGETNGTQMQSKADSESSWNYAAPLMDTLEGLLEQEFLSDVTIVLTENEDKGSRVISQIKAHKIFLRMKSRYFFRNLDAESKSIVLKNADIQLFKMMLKYIYTGESGANIAQALPLLKYAVDFEVDGLILQCQQLLTEDLNDENVLATYKAAWEYKKQDLVNACLTYICRNARRILLSPDLYNLPLDALLHITKRDDLMALNEVQVFNAFYSWGEKNCERNGGDPEDPASMKKVLAKGLTHIRFPLMDKDDFVLEVTERDVLDWKDLITLQSYFLLSSEKRSRLRSLRYDSAPRTYWPKDGNLFFSRLSNGVLPTKGTVVFGPSELLKMRLMGHPAMRLKHLKLALMLYNDPCSKCRQTHIPQMTIQCWKEGQAVEEGYNGTNLRPALVGSGIHSQELDILLKEDVWYNMKVVVQASNCVYVYEANTVGATGLSEKGVHTVLDQDGREFKAPIQLEIKRENDTRDWKTGLVYGFGMELL